MLRDKQRFNPHHEAILSIIVSLLSANTLPTAKLSFDLGFYAFSQHAVATDLHPDIVWWDGTAKEILLIELTVCFVLSFKHVAEHIKDY